MFRYAAYTPFCIYAQKNFAHAVCLVICRVADMHNGKYVLTILIFGKLTA